MIPDMLVFNDESPTFGPLEKTAVLELNVVFKKEYDTYILQVWYFSIDIHFILLHKKFGNGLSISVLKNRTKFLKKSNVFNGRPSTQFPFKLLCAYVKNGQDLAHLHMSETYSKE
jgi:hypothetical protein